MIKYNMPQDPSDLCGGRKENMMKNKGNAEKLNNRCASYIVYYSGLADGVFGYTANRLMNTWTG